MFIATARRSELPGAASPTAATRPSPQPSLAAPQPSNAPSPWLPGAHFAAALAFFAAGGVGLVLVAPEIASGAFFVPRVVAVVHLVVLGWIVLSIFGALSQFLPVAVGQPLRWTSLAWLSFGAHVGGVVLFVASLVWGNRVATYAGAALLTTSFSSFALNLVAALARAEERPLTWWALLGASLFLLLTPAFGLALAMNLHGDVQLAQRFFTVAIHAHVAIVGFVLVVMVGVAHRLLPMFLLSHGASEAPGRASVALLIAGAALLALQTGGRLLVAGSAVSIAGVLAFLAQAVAFFRHRKRKAIDPGMRLAAAGLAGLLVACALVPLAMSRGISDRPLLVAYFVVLIGSIALFVAGHFFKIIPFIVWYHRFGPFVGIRKVPKIAELYSERAAGICGVLLVAGGLGLAASAFAGSLPAVRASSIVFLAGALLLVLLIAKIAARRSE